MKDSKKNTMNAFQIKVHLLKEGLTISAMARHLEPLYGATFDSLRMMLTNLFYYGVRNDRLAALVKKEFKITVDSPRTPSTVKDAVRRAA